MPLNIFDIAKQIPRMLKQLTTEPLSVGNAVGGNSLAKLLERLLDSSLYWYNRLGASYRPETDGKVMAKCSQWLRSNRLPAEDSTEAVTFLRDFTMRQVFELLANLAWSSEALSSFSKVYSKPPLLSTFLLLTSS